MSHLTVKISDKNMAFYVQASFARTSISNRKLAIMPDILLYDYGRLRLRRERKVKNAVTDTTGLKGTSLILSACSRLCRAPAAFVISFFTTRSRSFVFAISIIWPFEKPVNSQEHESATVFLLLAKSAVF